MARMIFRQGRRSRTGGDWFPPAALQRYARFGYAHPDPNTGARWFLHTVMKLKRALGSEYGQLQVIGIAGHETAGVDHAQGPIGKFHVHRGAVVGVERIVADPVALGLVEGLEASLNATSIMPMAMARRSRGCGCRHRRARRSSRARRQPPQPFVFDLASRPSALLTSQLWR